MFRLRILGFIFAAALLSFVGCTEENIDETVVTTDPIDPGQTTVANGLLGRSSDPGNSEEGLPLDCVTVLFPFELVDEAGNTYAVNSYGDFENLLMDTASVFIVDFVYPLNISVDGEVSSAEDAEALGEAFAACLPDGGWDEDFFPAYEINLENSCYALSYPVSLQKVDGTIVVANSEDEFVAILVEEPVGFVFPLTLVSAEGETVTVSDVDGLFGALISCNGSGTIDSTDWNTGFEYIGCYALQFPFNVVDFDGNIIVVNNHQEFCDLLLTGSVMNYAYPMTLMDESGNVFTVNSEDELNDKLNECYSGGGGGPVDEFFLLLMAGTQPQDSTGTAPCYVIQYPLTVTFTSEDGTTETVVYGSDEEVFNSPLFPIGNVELPVTVITKWGDTLTINSPDELIALLSDCNG